jgi:hydrogenase maturation protease
MNLLIIGLGNPILGDDSAGWRAAEWVAARLGGEQAQEGAVIHLGENEIEVDSLAVGGLRLMERLIGFDRAILIDTIKTGKDPIGTVSTFRLEDLPDLSVEHMTAVHDASLQTALEVGRAMGAQLPDEIYVVGIEAERVYEFSSEVSPPVAAAIPVAGEAAMTILRQMLDSKGR